MASVVYFLFMMMFIVAPAMAHVRNIQDNFQVVYSVIDASGNHVTGETVTVKIKKVSNGNWYDFSDNTFKGSGWGDKDGTLTEDSTEGFYYYTFDPPSSESAAEQYQFLIDNASSTYGDHQSMTVTYQKVFNSYTDTVTVATNNDKTGYALSASGLASVNTEVDTALSDIKLDKLLNASATLSSDVNLASVMGQLLDNGTAWSYSRATDSIEVLADASAPSAATIADAVWDEAQSGHTTAGTFGKYLDAQVSTIGGGSLTEAGIADAVWDELLSGHTTTGSSGKLISSINDATDGDQEAGAYTGIEKLVRRHGN